MGFKVIPPHQKDEWWWAGLPWCGGVHMQVEFSETKRRAKEEEPISGIACINDQ